MDGEHVAALNDLVETWRELKRGVVPRFDPADGGVDARLLVLLERPAPATIRLGEQALCSEDNHDATNTTLKAVRQRVGIPRSQVVKWNAVPWSGLDGADLAADRACVTLAYRQLRALLHDVEVVITVGSIARDIHMRSLTSLGPTRPLTTLAVPHPSPRNTHHRKEALLRLDSAYETAAVLLAA
jgi:hypothetical protein